MTRKVRASRPHLRVAEDVNRPVVEGTIPKNWTAALQDAQRTHNVGAARFWSKLIAAERHRLAFEAARAKPEPKTTRTRKAK